ncbi:hypothetical protein BVH03_15430 [Pseudomonas sp. PA15(2017)]|uniref:hypothetical protein n=1 Tax=Pseudomonas sp. PA15(2017) TaxID=1932111 RepID=UPI000964C545|nr:hypothetical protein [Pseudomonas sp. PA15(2017)]OLU26714.1 hypothetical protein BVH03_15430 [Pseudomonas sp. PA15(2017)]
MNKITGPALLLAALFSAGVQADDDGLTLQQQRDRIGDEMVRDRTGAPPASESDTGQATDSQQQQPEQQSPRSTLNSPARDQTGQQPAGQNMQRQPSTTTPGAGAQGGANPATGSSGNSSAPATPGSGGAAISN